MCKPGKRPDGPIISRASPGRKHPYWTGLLSKFPGVSCPEWSLTPGRLAAAFNPPLPTRNNFKNSPGVFILSSVRKRGEPPPLEGHPSGKAVPWGSRGSLHWGRNPAKLVEQRSPGARPCSGMGDTPRPALPPQATKAVERHFPSVGGWGKTLRLRFSLSGSKGGGGPKGLPHT